MQKKNTSKIKSIPNKITQEFLRNVNSVSGIGKSSKQRGLTKIFGDDNGTVLENQEVADYMNQFYVSAGPKLAE